MNKLNLSNAYGQYRKMCFTKRVMPLNSVVFSARLKPVVEGLKPGKTYLLPHHDCIAEYVGTGVVDGAQKFFETWVDGDLSGQYVSADEISCRELPVVSEVTKNE